MSEEQQRFGDGQDNYLQGVQKGMQAAKQAAAVGKTAEAGANAAAATVQGSVETGKAAANIAAGAAAGGPWGAILSAAWSIWDGSAEQIFQYGIADRIDRVAAIHCDQQCLSH